MLEEIRSSRYFSIIIDEAMDISVTKSLGLCIHNRDNEANIRVRAVKVIDLKQGTAEAITDAVFNYVSASSLDQQKLIGGA